MNKIKNDQWVKRNILMYIIWVRSCACMHAVHLVMKLATMRTQNKCTCTPMLCTSRRLSWFEEYFLFHAWGNFSKVFGHQCQKTNFIFQKGFHGWCRRFRTGSLVYRVIFDVMDYLYWLNSSSLQCFRSIS